jgi:5-methylcytosine-specific restriction protein A
MPSGRICLGCGSLVVGMDTERCAPCITQAAEDRATVRRAYRRSGKDLHARGVKRRKVYDHPAWREVRKRVIQRDGACRMCGATERLTVHHIRAAADDDAGALDMDNLVTLCAPCHGRVDGPKAARAARKRAARNAYAPRIIGRR